MAFSVAGIADNDAKGMDMADLRKALKRTKLVTEEGDEGGEAAIAVHFANKEGNWLKLGNVPATLLATAHKNRWLDRGWTVTELHSAATREEGVVCRLQSSRDMLIRSLQNDATLYTGSEMVTIKYEKKDGTVIWRDVIPLSKRGDPWRDGTGFRGADGSCDKFGGAVPKHYRYASILDASTSREARKLVAAAAMDRVLEELRNDDA